MVLLFFYLFLQLVCYKKRKETIFGQYIDGAAASIHIKDNS